MERRALLKCLVGLVAAPAIIKVAGIMPVNASLQPHSVGWNYNTVTGLCTEVVEYPVIPQASVDVLYSEMQIRPDLLTQNMITRHTIKLFTEGNAFLGDIDKQYEEQFGAEGAKIGTQLRIRLPSDFTVVDNHPLPRVPDGLAFAAAAVAIAPAVLKTPITRRFWAKAA